MNQDLANVTIQLVTHNSAKDLPPALEALKSFTHPVQIRCIDNGSDDNSVAMVQAALPNAEIITLPTNTGYVGAHNVGFAMCTTPYVLVLNPDVVLREEGLRELVSAIDSQKDVAAAQGLILREGETIIDSTGIVRTITLNAVDAGAGNAHTNQYRKPVEIDGVTGACGLFSMKALQKVAYGSYDLAGHKALEVFDKDFFAYKEDADLGWRLQSSGQKNMFYPVHIGTHKRAIKPRGFGGFLRRLGDSRTRLSLRNYVWMIVKNASVKELLIHEIFIDARLFVFLLLSIIYPPLFSVWIETLQGISNMIHKRAHETINN